MSLDTDAIGFIARERGIHPAFVEKDWYATQVIRAIAEFQATTITPIFSGGTSLSKAYGFIQRFSEDLDFRARFETDPIPNKTARRAFRQSMLEAIETPDNLTLDKESLVIGSNYFKCSLQYPQSFKEANALRPTLQVEFSYTQPKKSSDTKSVISMVADYKGGSAETRILCLSPIETAADKLSALTWRVLKRDRSAPYDDPAMVRHLHDLYALSEEILSEQAEFVTTALAAFDVDNQTKKRKVDRSLGQAIKAAAAKIRDDRLYEDEYSTFVNGMSYAAADEQIGFAAALDNFSELSRLFDG